MFKRLRPARILVVTPLQERYQVIETFVAAVGALGTTIGKAKPGPSGVNLTIEGIIEPRAPVRGAGLLWLPADYDGLMQRPWNTPEEMCASRCCVVLVRRGKKPGRGPSPAKPLFTEVSLASPEGTGDRHSFDEVRGHGFARLEGKKTLQPRDSATR